MLGIFSSFCPLLYISNILNLTIYKTKLQTITLLLDTCKRYLQGGQLFNELSLRTISDTVIPQLSREFKLLIQTYTLQW